MSEPDTSAEAVMQLAQYAELAQGMPVTAATLRALLAERDAAQAQADRWLNECERLRLGGCARGQTTTQWCAEAVQMLTERDAARAMLFEQRVDALEQRMRNR